MPFLRAGSSPSLKQFTGEIHNSCFMQLSTNLAEKLEPNGSKMSSRRMGSSKMALKYIVMYCDTLCENLTHYPLHWDLHWSLLTVTLLLAPLQYVHAQSIICGNLNTDFLCSTMSAPWVIAVQRWSEFELHIVQFFNIAGLRHNKRNYEGFTSHYPNATALVVMRGVFRRRFATLMNVATVAHSLVERFCDGWASQPTTLLQ